jgi:hypothetical protein
VQSITFNFLNSNTVPMNYINLKKIFIFFFAIFFFTTLIVVSQEKNTPKSAWKKMQMILDNLKYPSIPNIKYSVLDYGAIADGIYDNTISINNTIKECSKNGGGKVVVPSGKYLTGPINLNLFKNLWIWEKKGLQSLKEFLVKNII